MSRHEGELINGSTAPAVGATLPEHLAPLLAVLSQGEVGVVVVVEGLLRFYRLVFKFVPSYVHISISRFVAHMFISSLKSRQTLTMIRQHSSAAVSRC